MSSFKDRMAEKTAGLRSTKEISVSEAVHSGRPATGPGKTFALQRLAEIEATGGDSTEISLEAITANPWQPRRHFDPIKLDELAQSIQDVGLIQPIIVRVNPLNPKQFQIIAGERRFRAHQIIGKDTIPALIRMFNDSDMAGLALVENLQREDLSDYEISLSIQAIEKQFPTKKKMLESVGVSKTHLYRYMRFQKLPGFVLESLEKKPNLMSCRVADELVTILDANGDIGLATLLAIWPEVLEGRLSASELPALLIKRIKRRAPTPTIAQKEFYVKGACVGQIINNGKTFQLRLKANSIPEEKEGKLVQFIEELLAD